MKKTAISLIVLPLASAGLTLPLFSADTVWKTETIYGGPPHCAGGASLALTGAGTPHISFYNGAEGLLMYATTDGAAWAVQTVPVNGPAGYWSSIAVDSSGRPHVAFCYGWTGEPAHYTLKYAYSPSNGVWAVQTVEAAPSVYLGGSVSIALDSSGFPHITHLNWTTFPNILKYAFWNGSSWVNQTVDAQRNPYYAAPIKVDLLGGRHICYYANWPFCLLMYAHSPDGTSWSFQTVDTPWETGQYPSLALDKLNRPRISYSDQTSSLRYASFDGAGWNLETVAPVTGPVSCTSLALDGGDNPHIGCYDKLGRLVYAHRLNGLWLSQIRERAALCGEGTSIALNSAGLPRITYNADAYPSPLKYASLDRGSIARLWGTDYDGDGTSDAALFRPSAVLWAIRNLTRIYFGAAMVPAPGDYAGDGTSEIASFRPSDGLWAVRDLTRLYLGSAVDTAVAGDYDGDGIWEPAIFRNASGLWAVRGLTRVFFGAAGDIAVPGYYSSEPGRFFAVVRRETGLWAVRSLTRLYFGSSNDSLVPGDYDGDGVWEAAVFRPASGLWAVRDLTRVFLGSSCDWAVPAAYRGDCRDLPAIFRESEGLWSVRGLTRFYLGSPGDLPAIR